MTMGPIHLVQELLTDHILYTYVKLYLSIRAVKIVAFHCACIYNLFTLILSTLSVCEIKNPKEFEKLI